MKKRDAVLLPFVLLLFIPVIFAETSGPENQIKLIPAPKEISVRQGGFHVRPTTKILVQFGHQDEDRIAAETLAEDIRDQSGLKLNITGAKADSKSESKQEDGAIVLARLHDKSVRDFLESAQWNKRPPAPALPPEVAQRTSDKYKEAYRVLAGKDL